MTDIAYSSSGRYVTHLHNTALCRRLHTICWASATVAVKHRLKQRNPIFLHSQIQSLRHAGCRHETLRKLRRVRHDQIHRVPLSPKRREQCDIFSLLQFIARHGAANTESVSHGHVDELPPIVCQTKPVMVRVCHRRIARHTAANFVTLNAKAQQGGQADVFRRRVFGCCRRVCHRASFSVLAAKTRGLP